MKFYPTELPGVYVMEPTLHSDSRGYFMETYCKRLFEEEIGPIKFVQDNQSRSSRKVIRGMHLQQGEYAQSKLVRCTEGAVLDVALDLRPDSPTYGRHLCVELSSDNRKQLFIPKGFAHGFAVLSEYATFEYKCDEYYAPGSEAGVNPFDPELGIEWPFTQQEAILSAKDLKLPLLRDLNHEER